MNATCVPLLYSICCCVAMNTGYDVSKVLCSREQAIALLSSRGLTLDRNVFVVVARDGPLHMDIIAFVLLHLTLYMLAI